MSSPEPVWNFIETSVIQPTNEPNIHQISLKALLFNFIFLYGIAVAAEVIPDFTGTVKRGFFCDDETIMYPYKKDTFSTSFLFTYCTLLVFFVIVLVEFYRLKRETAATQNPRYRVKNSTVHIYFVRTFTYFAYSQIGFVTILVLTNTTKGVAGRLRPHFLDVCKPIGTNCTQNPMQFVENYNCTGKPDLVEEARKSFFSGHSSFSMYATIWCLLYMQARLGRIGGNKVIVPMFQTLLLAFGLTICYSRISDYKHHWSDVLVGIFAGSFVAAYTCLCWTGLFRISKTSSSLLPSNSPFMLVSDDRRDSITSHIEHINSPESDIEQGTSKLRVNS